MLVLAAGLLVILLVAVAVGWFGNLLQGVAGQIGGRTIDRSQPVVLQSVRDLARFEGASGSFQVIVDLEKDAPFLPAGIAGQRTLFVATGSVDAFVDFSGLRDDAVTVSSDRKSVAARLPRAVLDKPNLDHARSYVFADERGIVDRLRSLFDCEPNTLVQLYQLAEKKISEAAAAAGLGTRAEANTRQMLQSLFRSLGYGKSTITFVGG